MGQQKRRGVWVKYQFKTDQGIKNLSVERAKKIAGEDSDYHANDLYNCMKNGNYLTWTIYIQLMKYYDTKYRFNPFDITKV